MVNLRIQKRYVCARGVVLVGRRGEAREAGSTARRGAGKDMRWIEGCAKEIEKRGVDGKTRRGEARRGKGKRMDQGISATRWITTLATNKEENVDYSTAPPHDEATNYSTMQHARQGSTATKMNWGTQQLRIQTRITTTTTTHPPTFCLRPSPWERI